MKFPQIVTLLKGISRQLIPCPSAQRRKGRKPNAPNELKRRTDVNRDLPESASANARVAPGI